jgi:DNA-directed RNA polymerase specialized sigma subunit
MAVSTYAEESLRLLHEGALHSFRTAIECTDSTALASAMTQLEAREQVVLTLVYFERLEMFEVAGVLDVRVQDAVRSHALAVYALIQQLEKRMQEPTSSICLVP